MIHLFPNPVRGEVLEHPLPDSLGTIPSHPGLTPHLLHAVLTATTTQEPHMSTAATITDPTATPAHHNGFIRFIDHLAAGFKKAGPAVLKIAEDAEPAVLALSPFGPEYKLAIDSIESATMLDQQLQTAGGPGLSDSQKSAIALTVGSNAIQQILASKGITEPEVAQQLSAKFIQDIYSLHTGAAVPPSTATGPAPAVGTSPSAVSSAG